SLVLVLHPQDAVLIFLETGHQYTLKARHHFFTPSRRQLLLREQKESLEKLNAKTWGVRYHEDSNGRFLVLPKGMKAETNWT
ncbi:hypothetical protein ACSLOE_30955, partial [Escherichia coli]